MVRICPKLKTHCDNDTQPIWSNNNLNAEEKIDTDYLICAGDTKIDLPIMNNLNPKLATYNNMAMDYDYIINWGETAILTNQNPKQNKSLIANSPLLLIL